MDLQHIAIIPDGSRRWAKLHGVSAIEGHRRGAEAMHNVVDYLIGHQIRYLTLWGFSVDNWKRDQEEVNEIFCLLTEWIKKDTPWLDQSNVRLQYIGRLKELPSPLQQTINMALGLTDSNRAMTLTLAFNYSGRAEIVDAIRQIIDDRLPAEVIDENLFNRYLYTDGIPDVDLVIRTAGDFRLSNFLLWQTAYSEYYFSPVLWPDFTVEGLLKALLAYDQRQRRFGGD